VSVIGVIGCSGGVGASTFTAVLAAVAGPTLLVDVDGAAGGIDVLLDIVDTPGARWSGMRLAGGHLDPEVLYAGLPEWRGCRVLAADAGPPDPEALHQVLTAVGADGSVVLDLPRAACAERAAALLHCELVVLVARSDVQGLAAVHAVAGALPETAAGAVLRRGSVSARQAAEAAGVPVLGLLPPLRPASGRLAGERLPGAMARVARGVLDGLVGGAGAVVRRPA
jgi:MinD-like ATPase involved in chromosome partitioning or flagellar assembly